MTKMTKMTTAFRKSVRDYYKLERAEGNRAQHHVPVAAEIDLLVNEHPESLNGDNPE